ncbi:MAG TPA: hypothetical protein DCY13_17375, partial [Verrucomicrobiales bacterium]|nr:hypothetical protein [Verrucomicrobiales bacterium]
VAAQGGIVLSENFTYADGPLVGNGASPWTGHSGTAGQVDVVAGKLNLTFAESQDVGAPLQGAPYTAAGTTSAL